MTLNKAKGRMFKSVGWTWNPANGCDHGCLFCWAKMLADKWGKPFEPQFKEHFLKDKMPNDGTWIFVCSTGDLFCAGMKDDWIYQVLYRIYEEQGNNKFLLQTKNPQSFLAFYLELEKIREKVILGTTLETNRITPWSKAPTTFDRKNNLHKMMTAGFKTFLSLEPLADFDLSILMRWIHEIKPEAIEIGLENYTSYLPKPPEKKILELLDCLENGGFEYVLKDNLASIQSKGERTP